MQALLPTSTPTPIAPAQARERVLGSDNRGRVRLVQLLTVFAIYFACALIMWGGAAYGLIPAAPLTGWCLYVAVGMAVFYLLIRSGWSQRTADPMLSEAQVVFGVVAVLWAYLMCGVWRSATLFPLMLILTFGAFVSSWRRLAALTVLALIGLAASIALLHGGHPNAYDWRADIANLLMMAVVLPTCSIVAARLSSLRARLHSQRDRLERALDEVQRLATEDELTGLQNRRRMQELLELEHSRSVRSGRTFCLAVIDLDHFGEINDEHGHAVGDQVLRLFAGEAKGAIRASDLLARWSDEAFVLLMPDTHAALARLGVERLRERTAATTIDAGASRLALRFSAGVVEHLAGESVSDAIGRAERALASAKVQGRNRVVVG
ncbi:MAG: diguanylate cyclase [Proteobacteria bacterium]|nr:diguanylate cyclase [Pseudomonadota bacterium]